jgi:ribosome-binding factor A
MKEGKRSERVGDLIHKEISEMLLKSIKDPRIGFVTITRVSVSEDCRLAKVYYSVLGSLADRDMSKRGLESAKGFIRKELGRRMSLRYTPEITFHFDPGIEYAVHIGEVLHHLHQEEEQEDGNGDGNGN